ncbi:hypothetical protein GCM10027058_06770 [Microbacterium neimengense]
MTRPRRLRRALTFVAAAPLADVGVLAVPQAATASSRPRVEGAMAIQSSRVGLAAALIALLAISALTGCAGKAPSAPPMVSAECQAHIDLTAKVQAQYNNTVTAMSYKDLPISDPIFNDQACVVAYTDDKSGDTLAYGVAIPERIIYYTDAVAVMDGKIGDGLSHGQNCQATVFCGDNFILAVARSEEPGFETQLVFQLQGDRR